VSWPVRERRVGWRLLRHLDRDLLALKSSPRGGADMLAATIFVDYVGRDEKLNIRMVSLCQSRQTLSYPQD
jgi:hypothetical protein